MRVSWLLLLLMLPLVLTLTLKGFKYNDNHGTYMWEESNGIASIKLDDFLPSSLTVCMRAQSFFNRHGNIQSWFVAYVNNDGKDFVSNPAALLFWSNSYGDLKVRTNGNDDTYNNGQTLVLNKE